MSWESVSSTWRKFGTPFYAHDITMSSNYNSRPRAAEVMVEGEQVHLVRKREEVAQLFAGKSHLP